MSVARSKGDRPCAHGSLYRSCMACKVESLERGATQSKLVSDSAIAGLTDQLDKARARVFHLERALAEIADEGCDTRPYATNCDSRCKDIARTAILTNPEPAPMRTSLPTDERSK